jgi:hypothetical protein
MDKLFRECHPPKTTTVSDVNRITAALFSSCAINQTKLPSPGNTTQRTNLVELVSSDLEMSVQYERCKLRFESFLE